MKNAIILHGGTSKKEYYDPKTPSMSNAHWIPWIQSQLLKHDIAAATPEVPNSYDRNWKAWTKEVERFEITPDTILVGHSTGGGYLIKYLSIHPILKVGKVVLVAPWLDPYHDKTENFFDEFEIDPDFPKRTKGITVFASDNDQKSVRKTVEIVRARVEDLKFKEFHNYGHFCYEDMKTQKFPELLKEVLANSDLK